MTLKRRFWYPVAIGAVVVNIAWAAYAFVAGELLHAMLHGVAAAGFAIWARYLQQSGAYRDRQLHEPDKVEMLEADVSELERQLRETQERLAFADQLLNRKSSPPH